VEKMLGKWILLFFTEDSLLLPLVPSRGTTGSGDGGGDLVAGVHAVGDAAAAAGVDPHVSFVDEELEEAPVRGRAFLDNPQEGAAFRLEPPPPLIGSGLAEAKIS